MRPLKIMLTCANGQIGPSVLALMKNHPIYNVSIVGVAAGSKYEGAGHLYCDNFYEVPMGSDPQYWERIYNIIEREHVQLVFIGSDEEALVLSQHAAELRSLGCSPVCSDYKVNLLSSNKYDLISHLHAAGIPVAHPIALNRTDGIEDAARALGYPEKEIIIKPKFGRGSKGLRIISDSVDTYQQFFTGQKTYITLDNLVDIFSRHPDKIEEYMIMEYLSGDKYSVDMLVDHGRVVCAVARNNGPEPKVNPPTQLADIVYDEDVIQYAESVAKCIGHNYFVQVEVGRDHSGKVKLIETNIRLDATLPITTGVSINFYHELMTYAVQGAFRRDIERVPRAEKTLRFIRYWQHAFVEAGK